MNATSLRWRVTIFVAAILIVDPRKLHSSPETAKIAASWKTLPSAPRLTISLRLITLISNSRHSASFMTTVLLVHLIPPLTSLFRFQIRQKGIFFRLTKISRFPRMNSGAALRTRPPGSHQRIHLLRQHRLLIITKFENPCGFLGHLFSPRLAIPLGQFTLLTTERPFCLAFHGRCQQTEYQELVQLANILVIFDSILMQTSCLNPLI